MHHVDILHAIGGTPLVELRHLSPRPEVRLFAKIEGRNPTGSVKDRIVREMVVDAQRTGRLEPGGRIIEASTGNTGIALAMVGRALGYTVRIVIPENVFPEIPRTLAAYGAEITWVPSELGVKKAIEVARGIAADEGWFMLDQFSDPVNIRAHYQGTGPEILDDLPHVDLVVAGLGTGGTLMGSSERLRESFPDVQIVAAEPLQGDPVMGLRSLEDGYVPPILDVSRLDRKILVSNEDSVRGLRSLLDREGILGGVSSGAVLEVGLRVARELDEGVVVCVLADGGWKYLSADFWTRSLDEVGRSMGTSVWW